MSPIAEEIGSAWLSIMPSMRGFSKMLKAELKKSLAGAGDIKIPVTPVLDKKSLGPLSLPSQRLTVPVQVDRDAFRRSLATAARDSRSTVHQSIKVDVDKDTRGSVLTSLLGLGDSAGKAGTSAGGTFTSAFGGVLSNPVTGLPGIILGAIGAALAAPFVALATGALALAGASLGAVFFGGFLLRGDAELQKGVKGLFDDVSKTLTEAAQPLKGPFLEALGIIGQAFRDIAPDIKTFFKDIADSRGIQELARGFGGFIKSFSETGALKKLGQAIGPVLKQIGMALPDIGNAISQFIITVTKPEFIEFVGKMLRGAADLIRFIGGAIGQIASFAKTVHNVAELIHRAINVVVSTVVGGPRKLYAAVFEAVGHATTFIGQRWRELWGSAATKVSTTVATIATTVKGIPGKITSALGNMGTLLLQAGKSVVQGLIDGIKAKFGALASIVSNVSGLIGSFFPNSPAAKRGALSGSGNPFHRGQAIAAGIAGGIESQLPTVNSAASQLAWAGAGRGSSSAAAAPGEIVLGFRSDGSQLGDALVHILSQTIDTRYGGNVTRALTRR